MKHEDGRLQPRGTKGGATEITRFFELGVRRVVARDQINRSLDQSLHERLVITGQGQRRVAFKVRIVVANVCLVQDEVMSGDFAAHIRSGLLCAGD